MSANQPENTKHVLNELSKVSNASQFLEGFKENPQIIFDAIKDLTKQSQDYDAAASVLQSAQSELYKKEFELTKANEELELVQQRIKRSEKNSTTSSIQGQSHTDEILNKLADVLDKWRPIATGPQDNQSTSIFNGDEKNFSTWKDGILMKIKSSPHQFPNEKSKMSYIYSKMNEGCQAHLHSWISDGELTFPSLKAMLHLLDILFDDPNRVQDAKIRLRSNKQRSKPFSSWISEIRRDAAISGYDKFPEPLRDKCLELKQALIHEKDIEKLDLDNAIARLQDIDNKQRLYTTSANRFRFRAPTTPGVNNSQQYENLTTTQGEDAMDLSASYSRPRGPLCEEEKGRRCRLGLCIYCGQAGHTINMCPIKPSRSISNSNVAGNSEKG